MCAFSKRLWIFFFFIFCLYKLLQIAQSVSERVCHHQRRCRAITGCVRYTLALAVLQLEKDTGFVRCSRYGRTTLKCVCVCVCRKEINRQCVLCCTYGNSLGVCRPVCVHVSAFMHVFSYFCDHSCISVPCLCAREG